MKDYALAKSESRLARVAASLEGREFLLERFSVADAYLFAVLNWSAVTPIDLRRWPTITAYMARMLARPVIGRAVAVEMELYRRELARHSVVAAAQSRT